jgi:nitrate/nitrite transporter NarK
MEFPRRRWDSDREPARRVFGRAFWQPFALLSDPRFRRLSVAAFVYAGLSLCLVAFMTVQLTTVVGLNLVVAGRVLAAYQIAGSVSRPIWGWIADRFLTPAQTLAVHGVGMAACSLLMGYYGPGWPVWAVMANALLAGCTAGGYTGVAYAEYATLGGTRRTEATGLGTAIFFAGGMVVPPVFGAAVAVLGGYRGSYWAGAACALASGVLLVWPHRR